MMTFDALWPYRAVADAIATLLHPHAEAIIHDLRTGKVAYVAHGFSQSRPGDLSQATLPTEHPQAVNTIGPCTKADWDGRPLRCVSAVVRPAPNAAPIGLICINLDVSVFESMASLAHSFLTSSAATSKSLTSLGADWQDDAQKVVGNFLSEHRATLARLTSQQRRDLVRRLDERGFFRIRNAVPFLTQITTLSRATLYKILKEIRA